MAIIKPSSCTEPTTRLSPEVKKIYFAILGKSWQLKEPRFLPHEYWMRPGIVRIDLRTIGSKAPDAKYHNLIVLYPID